MFVEDREDEIVFSDGWKAYVKHEMTAGDQEDLEDYMVDQQRTGAGDAQVRRLGGVKLVSLNLRRVVSPEGVETRPGYDQVRKMRRAHFARLLGEIAARNPPLGGSAPAEA